MAFEQTLITALLIGLLGSTHCIGMCGGIVSALTLGVAQPGESRLKLPLYLLAYNSGRVLSYSIAGAIAGALGETIFSMIDHTTAINTARLISGVFLLALGVYLAGWTQSLAPLENLGNALWVRIKPLSRRFIPIRTLSQAWFSGMLWGWLPCGLVYSALVWALTSANAVQGALIMLVFGLATIPVMFLTGLTAVKFGRFVRHPWLKRTTGFVLILMAALHLSGKTFHQL